MPETLQTRHSIGKKGYKKLLTEEAIRAEQGEFERKIKIAKAFFKRKAGKEL